MSTFIDVHIIQNVAPNCLNRDDTGAPKDAIFGGHRRARISSQCLKRAARLHFSSAALIDQDELATRTRNIVRLIIERLDGDRDEATNATVNALKTLGMKIEVKMPKDGEPAVDPTAPYLLFLSNRSIDQLVGLIQENIDELAGEKISNDLKKAIKSAIRDNTSPDVALFGRMLADATNLNVDAAAQVAHALSTNRIERESDFFTAVDDFVAEDQADAGHLGSKEYNSSCLYRFSTINLDLLANNLNGDHDLAKKTVASYIRSAVLAIPSGSQNSFAAHNLPNAVAIGVHTSQPISLAGAFENPVWHGDHQGGLSAASVTRLQKEASKLTKAYGLELGMVVMDTTGGWEGTTIDSLDQLVEVTIAALN